MLNKIFIFLISFLCISACISNEHTQGHNFGFNRKFSKNFNVDRYFFSRQNLAQRNFFSHSAAADDDEAYNENSADIGNSRFNHEILYAWPTLGTLTSPFGVRTLGRHTRMHNGIDVGAVFGSPISAAAQGQVLFAGIRRGYGYAIIIGHDNSHQTLYAHMSKINVNTGQFVTQKSLIGRVGKTGHATGPHLHFETRFNGIPYNPIAFLPFKKHINILNKHKKTRRRALIRISYNAFKHT